MRYFKFALFGSAAGVGLAVLAIFLAIGGVGPIRGDAQSGDAGAVYVVFATAETRARLAQPDVVELLQLSEVADGDAARTETLRSNVDGIILDGASISDLPAGTLASLFASGRVLVVFNVEKQDVLRLANSADAFPETAGLDVIPDVTLNPGPATGGYKEPFFSVVYRSRPGLPNIVGGELTLGYTPELFALVLNERAMNARGVVEARGQKDEVRP